MNAEFRITTTALNHPKIVKLKRRLGAEGVLALLTLWAWTASERPSGALTGLDEEDLAIVAGWPGDERFFITTLIELKLLDWDGDSFATRDLEEQNQRATSDEERSERARNAAQKRWGTEKSVTFMLENAKPMLNDDLASCRIDEHVRTVQYCSSSSSTTTTPNPSSSTPTGEAETDRAEEDGDPSPEEGGTALDYPASLTPYQRQQAETLVRSHGDLAQALLDELAAAIKGGRIKTSPVAYLRALVKRAAAGEFNPDAGVKIARDRERRQEAERAVRAAAARPPTTEVAALSGRGQTGTKAVRSHIEALKAALKMPGAPGADEARQPQRAAA